MSKAIIFTHLFYICLFALVVFLVREPIVYLYIQNQLNNSQAIEVLQDVCILDEKGRKVGVLNAGISLMPPNIEDLRDTDIGDNSRFKLLIDLESGEFKMTEKRNLIYRVNPCKK